jgi:predicted acyltransferase
MSTLTNGLRVKEAQAEMVIAPKPPSQDLLVSLDFFRGFTMFMLVGECTGLYELLRAPAFGGALLGAIGLQLDHHPWNGLRCWDLVQPFFMFIVGVAMPFAIGRRWERGDSWGKTFKHALTRSGMLLLCGWALYCIQPGHLTFQLWNVLAQLSFTYLVAFLMMRKSTRAQLGFTFALLIITELLCRLWPVPGFNQPWVPDHNFGSWFDLKIMPALNGDHWVAFNAVPTTAHTMWGVLAGQLLKSSRTPWQKIRTLILPGIIGVIVGFSLSPVDPIIKRTCPASFVIASRGFALLALALSYWLIDVCGWKRWAPLFVIVGMNPLFIYLFTSTGGAEWLHRIAKPFTEGLFFWANPLAGQVATSIAVWGMLWGLCYWLYKRKIFLRL